MPHLAALDPITGEVIEASKTTAVRHERARPGEPVHMDVKKIGRIPDGGGWRLHGRANRETTRDRTSRLGYDFVHSLVDDHSRLASCEILSDEKGPTCAEFLTRAPPTSPPTAHPYRTDHDNSTPGPTVAFGSKLAMRAVTFDLPKTGVVGVAYAPGGQILGTWKL